MHEEVFNRTGGVPGLAGSAAGGLAGYGLGNYLQKKYQFGFPGEYLPAALSVAGLISGGATGKFIADLDKNSSSAYLMAEAGKKILSTLK